MMGNPAEKAREKRVADLVKRGSATGNEILIAQFGEIPVGLEQDQPLNDLITFEKAGKDPDYKFYRRFLEYAYINENEAERKIYINKLMMGPVGKALGLVATRMALARVHDIGEAAFEFYSGRGGEAGLAIGGGILALTVLSSFRYAMFSSLVKAVKPSLANTIGEEMLHTLATKGEEKSWITQNAFRANAEEMLKNKKDSLSDALRGFDAFFTMLPRRDFRMDGEIFARIFNLAVRGYPEHGRLPRGAAEGQAFLMDMGIKTPTKARIYFQADQFEAMREVFFRHNQGQMGRWFPPSAEINIGINSYRNKGVLEMYWKDAFPVMLGEMFQLLGNSRGLERFGFDTNNRDMKGVPFPLRPEEPHAPLLVEKPQQ